MVIIKGDEMVDRRTNLRSCSELKTCETVLKQRIRRKKILGNVLFSREEARHVESLLKKAISQKVSRILLQDEASLAISLLLVWKGSHVYPEDIYWECICQDLQVDDTAAWRSFFQDSFRQTIEEYGLIQFQTGEDYFTEEILAHTGLPKGHLDHFFSSFFYPVFRDLLWVSDTFHGTKRRLLEIKDQVAQHRLVWEKRRAVSAKIRELSSLLRMNRNILNTWGLLQQVLYLSKQRLANEDVKKLLLFPEDYLEKKEKQLQVLGEEIVEKQNESAELTNRFMKYCQGEIGEKNIQCIEEQMNELGHDLFLFWQLEMGEVIQKISFSRLRKVLGEDTQLKGKRRIVEFGAEYGFLEKKKSYVEPFSFLQKKKRMKTLLHGLPFRDSFFLAPDLSLLYKLEELQGLYLTYLTKQESLEEYKKELGVLTFLPQYGEDTKDQERLIARMNELEVELKRLKKVQEEQQQEFHEYKKHLSRITPGVDVTSGLQILKEQRDIQETINGYLHQIKGVEEEKRLLSFAGETRERIRERLWKYRSRLQALLQQERELHRTLLRDSGAIHSQKDYIHLFLLQGGRQVEEYLSELMIYWRSLIQEDSGPKQILSLPPYLRQGLNAWWKNFSETRGAPPPKALETVQGAKTHYLQQPAFFFSQKLQQVVILLPEQFLDLANWKEEISLRIIQGQGEGSISQVRLDYDRLSFHRALTFPQEIQLAKPHGGYQCQLLLGRSVLCSWTISAQQYYLFDETGRMLEGKECSREVHGIVGERGLEVWPEDAVLQRIALSGAWADHSYWQLDPEKSHLLLLQGETGIYGIKKEEDRRAALFGGNVIPGCTIDGERIYAGDPPDILLFFEAGESIHHWRLQCIFSREVISCTLDELQYHMERGENFLRFSLKNLLGKRYGLIEIILHRANPYPRQEGFMFFYLSRFQVNFQQQYYPPLWGSRNTGGLQMHLPADTSFEPMVNTPNSNGAQGFFRSSFSLTEDILMGSLSSAGAPYPWEGSMEIQLPVLAWRLEGVMDNWCQEVVDFWIGDILPQGDSPVQVKLPQQVESLEVSLLFGDQRLEGTAQKNVVTLPFFQSYPFLQEAQKAVQEVYAVIRDQKGEEQLSLLFRVRTRWQVTQVRIGQRLKKGEREVWVSWINLGKCSSQRLLIWSMKGEKNRRPLVVKIPYGKNQIQITRPETELPVGHYRLQFLSTKREEEWDYFRPAGGSENTVDTSFGDGRQITAMVLHYGLEMMEVEDREGNRYPLKDPVFLLNVTQDKKGGFLDGHLFYGRRPLETNPVTFHIQLNKEIFLPFLLDRENDGPMYCKECQQIFWDVVDGDHQMAHMEPALIVVRINKGLHKRIDS